MKTVIKGKAKVEEDMKILKKAEQKNFIVRRDFYTLDKLFEMYDIGYIYSFDDNFNIIEYNSLYDIDENDVFRVSADIINEVKVIYLTDFGFYTNVAVLNDGNKVFISLD